MNKWYVIRLSDKTMKDYSVNNRYVVVKYGNGLEKAIADYGDTAILITPSEDIAENTKKVLNEQLREQSN